MEQEILTLLEHLKSLPTFSGVRDGRSLIIGEVLCTSLFVIFFLPWYCLTFLDVCLLITVLVSSHMCIKINKVGKQEVGIF